MEKFIASVPSILKNMLVNMLSTSIEERPKINDILSC